MRFKLKSLIMLAVSIVTASVLTAGASAATIGAGTVNVDILRLRSQPNTDSAILATATDGSNIILLDDCGDGWYKVIYNRLEGYMLSDYFDISTTADINLGSASVDASAVNLRTGPSTDSAIVTTVIGGNVVDITGIDLDWFKVTYEDFTGYIHSDYLDLKARNEAYSDEASQIITYARSLLGTPYVYGGSSPSGFDCSGFVGYVYKNFGYSLKRTAADMLANGSAISQSELLPGDLVFFKADSAAASHVGIYIGNNEFIHSATGGVKITSMSSSYYASYYTASRRVLS